MKLPQDVLQALSGAETDGSALRLVAQLDRALYVKVNKALEAVGGKWNRKAKAHLFDGDAADRIEEVLLTGEVTTARDIGFFPTPPEIGAVLCRAALIGPGMTVLEPSAGKGDLAQAILRACPSVRLTLVERDERLATHTADRFGGDERVSVVHRDFFSWQAAGALDRIVMNPPFLRERTADGVRTHLDHVRRAFGMLCEGGRLVSVLPASVAFRDDRSHVTFRDWAERYGGEVLPLPAEAFKASGTSVQTVFLTMVRS